MKPSNHLSEYAIFLGLGVAIGVGAANFFAAGGDHGKAAAPSAAKAQAADAPSAAKRPSEQRLASLEPAIAPTEQGAGGPALLEDISLLETASTDLEETAATEPTPAEIVKALPAQRPPTQRVSQKEADELEGKLRQESETASPVPTQGSEGLLGHERP
ncbi:MAG: hypothetical protein ACOYMG_05165 [Candidatus Methylumidiphilus sp.]